MRFTDTNADNTAKNNSKIACETATQKGYITPDGIIRAADYQEVRGKIFSGNAKKKVTLSGTSKIGYISDIDGVIIYDWDAGSGHYTAEQIVTLIVTGTNPIEELFRVFCEPVDGDPNSFLLQAIDAGQEGNYKHFKIESAVNISGGSLLISAEDETQGTNVKTFYLSGGYDKANLASEQEIVDLIKVNPKRFVAALTKVVNTNSTEINLDADSNGQIIRCTSSSSVIVNMPDVDPDEDFSVAFIRGGSGSVTFIANGKTLQTYNGLVAIAGQNAWASVTRTGVDTYNISGTLA